MLKRIHRISLFAVICLLSALCAFAGGFLLQGHLQRGAAAAITAERVAQEITGISQYASLEYRYTSVGRMQDQADFYGWKVPFTGKSFIVMFDGSIKLGIEAADIRVTVREHEICVRLPPAQILSHEIREETLEVLEQSSSLANQIRVEDYTLFFATQKERMEQKAREDGLFEEATLLAREQLLRFLENLPGIRDRYTLVFA